MANALITKSMMDIGPPPLMAPGAESTAELDVHTRDLRGTAMTDASLADNGGAAMPLHPQQEGATPNGPTARALSAEIGRTGDSLASINGDAPRQVISHNAFVAAQAIGHSAFVGKQVSPE